MKNRLVFRIGTFFLSASFMMGVIHTAADQNVLAEEASGEELITIVPEETEAPQTAETSSEEAGSTVPEKTEVKETPETPETAEEQTTEKASETVETETDPEVVIVPDVRETEGTEPTEVPETETQETEGSGEGSDIIVIDPETESETASEPESEAVIETERTLTSVSLKVDQDLESVPVTFLEQLNELEVYSVILVYSDGSTSLPDKAEETYDVSVDYEDVSNADGSVHRTYHAVVKELENGKEFEDSSSIDIGIKAPAEIKTEEMTTVILEGKKKWAVVRSTPEITGRYAMNSDRLIKKMYYASEGGEAVCAEKAFELQAGITYQFLISLN